MIRIVKREIERERVNAKELREEDITRYLKKHKLTKYNGQINLILFRIDKIKPIEISQWMEDEMKSIKFMTTTKERITFFRTHLFYINCVDY